ncbi:MAG TPA: amino acid adenylation domain-containing protein [Ktedonosporobacter sp.]|jgi:amino acid adenylation domain-containing protein|nr:amino acid adenylation domain-containing protein [Ktedonosporobacter sp.]
METSTTLKNILNSEKAIAGTRFIASEEYPEIKHICQLFEQQASLTPGAVAVVYEGEQITYQALNQRANQLAHFLRQAGVQSESLVGICLDRSIAMIVGLLGILKAGGAYVPLDPKAPVERLRETLTDAQIQVLLAQHELKQQLQQYVVHALDLEQDWETIAQGCMENPSWQAYASQPAYVIYTSGSTGKPKGVVIEHRQLLNYVFGIIIRFGFVPGMSFAVLQSITADFCNTLLFPALCQGGTLHLIAEQRVTDPDALADYFKGHTIDCLKITPSHWAALAASGQVAQFLPQHRLIFGGEALNWSIIEQIAAQTPRCLIFNHYGPTETTIGALTYDLRSSNRHQETALLVPIGKPVAHAQVYVLDEHGSPVAPEASGELYIGGAGVARGYLHRPELTAERFVPNPFGSEPGERLYKTGDHVRVLADGSIEFIGRLDDQVKIRGFRVEPGEVAAVLREHPAIQEAIVVAREDHAGEKRLIAYVVTAQEEASAVATLRDWLGEKLPQYMVPATFVLLEHLPLLPNGKVNRRALPEPEHDQRELNVPYVAPRTALEELLAGIWADVLRRQVGVFDDFFVIAGHSLLAMQVIARLRKAVQVELPINILFKYPTIAALAEQVELARKNQSEAGFSVLEVRTRPALLPLSLAQQGLWVLHQLDPQSPFYNIPVVLSIRGPLQREALERSLTEIVRRHEALRTTIDEVDGQPVQHIHPPSVWAQFIASASFGASDAFIDLQSLPVEQREEKVQQLAKAEAMQPFDLSQGPLIRGKLLCLAPTEHVLILTAHHIVFDGWSKDVFLRELGVLYEAFSQEQGSPLSELPLQYADYTLWQREWSQEQAFTEQITYWRQQLAGATTTLSLPTDRPRPPVQTFRGAAERFSIDASLVAALKELSRREGVTLFMTLLAAFNMLLARYSGQNDVLVGSPTANRSQLELEDLVGFFVNTLVLRTDLSGNPSFRTLLQRVREMTLAAYDHQDLPFDRLVQELKVERSSNSNPLFQAAFVLQNILASVRPLTNLEMSSLEVDSGTAKFDVMLELTEIDGGMRGKIEYSTDLFDAGTIKRMVGHLQTLLHAIVADPEQSIMQYPLLPPAEEQTVVHDWNATQTPFPQDRCVHELFEEQVRVRPDAIALACEERALSYRALDQRVNGLAWQLRELGVGPEVPVGICMERSLELVVALLAILKAGGIYVPLDPGYPRERLAFMIADARITILLTQRHLYDRLSAEGLAIYSVDNLEEEDEDDDVVFTPPEGLSATNLAYIIYTSGSTGTPKGVCVTHANIARLVKEANFAAFAPQEVFLQSAPVSFDASTLELWGSLLNGARLVVFPSYTSSLNELQRAIEQYCITVLWITSGLFSQMVEYHLESLQTVKYVITGGDIVSVPHAKKILAQRGGCTLVNGYGPTENTTFTSCYFMTQEEQVGNSVSIGSPVANTQVYILDAYMQPVPIGVPGELYTGGKGLARGYLHQPALTAEKFIPDPFGAAGERLYRTGDLARYRPDGTIEFLGRIDYQVKVSGFRIELGEIETVLGQHPAVREVVVIVREDQPGTKRLVAYIVSEQQEFVAGDHLKTWLRERLPQYMMPTVFVVLEQLPLSPNGKVDRRALPMPEHDRIELAASYVAPRTAIEEIMAGIWCQVLNLDRVSVFDNFFAIGGYSLLAIKVLAHLYKALEVDLPLHAIFEYPTLAALAEQAEIARWSQEKSSLPALNERSRPALLPLSLAQQRLWFLHQLDPESPFYNIPMALRIRGWLDVEALERSLAEIVRRHETLRTTIDEIEGQPVQFIHPAFVGAGFIAPVIDIQHLPVEQREEQAQRIVNAEAMLPFDLSQGPLIRSKLLCLTPTEYVLVLTVHHIVFDGWSKDVFERELISLYGSFSQEQISSLPELRLQYADYTLWQREWLQTEMLERQMTYWRQQLAGATTVLNLPTDRPRPPIQTFRGAVEHFTIDPSLSVALSELSRREGVTLFMTLLAAFNVLLARYSGQSDVLLGSPTANRRHLELEELMGFFVNTLVLRTDLSGNPSFRTLLQRVREMTLTAYAHQDLPFERLVEAVQPERSLSYNPLFQVAFALWISSSAPIPITGIALEPFPIEGGTAKQDMMVDMLQTATGLQMRWEYSVDLFDATTIRRMAAHFQTLLHAIVAHPEQSIMQYPLLPEQEQQVVLHDWNATQTPYAQDHCIHELFEEQVRARPDAVALVFEEQTLSYRALDECANRLAWRLRGLGVGPEVLVGLCMERSPELVVTLLGILKAGGAYVPLDPGYPRERLTFMLTDARIAILLTQNRLRERLPAEGLSVYGIEDLIETELTDGAVPPPPVEMSVANLAYVIYTSGSTGTPKGVMVSHRGLASLSVAQAKAFGTQPENRMLQFASLSFDASIWEIVMALSIGATLCLATQETLMPGPSLLHLLQEQQITTATLSPSVLAVLPQQDLPVLQTLITAGEACSAELVANWSPGRNFFNAYGPTETTVCASVALCQNDKKRPTIGKPIANMQMYVLDAHWQPCPIGVPGELYLGGVGLARGYLYRPELSAQRFIPHPFSLEPGARLYRTGDRASLRPDGNIEFLGRLDHQVKIRGFRIELGEIEEALNKQPSVHESVVIVREDVPGEKRLVAYLIPEADNAPVISDVRQALKERLPEYMLPAAFVVLDALPITSNAKVDVKALPAPEAVQGKTETTYVAPESQIERDIAAIWCDILHLEKVGVHENFFDLGGHSLLLARLQDRLQTVLHKNVSLLDLFQHTTISALAALLSRNEEEAAPLQQSHGWSAARSRAVEQQRQLRRSRQGAKKIEVFED